LRIVRKHYQRGRHKLPGSCRKLIQSLWPTCTGELKSRELVTADLAVESYLLSALAGVVPFGWLPEVLTNSAGFGGQGLANVLTYLAVSPSRGTFFIQLVRRGWMRKGLAAYIGACKVLHTATRCCDELWLPGYRTAGQPPEAGLYLQLLAGRFAFASTWAGADVAARAAPGPPQWLALGEIAGGDVLEQCVEEAQADVVAVFAAAVREKAGTTREEFLANLHRYGTSGSTRYDGVRTGEVLWEGKRFKVAGQTKNSVVNSLDLEQLETWLTDHEPELRGTGVAKYEASKQRLLLPGPFYHWLVESIALYSGEGAVYRHFDEFAMNYRAVEEFAETTRRLAATRPDSPSIVACSDYADYNISHSLERMRRMWLMMAQALDPAATARTAWGDLPWDRFVAAACSWAAAALLKVAAAPGRGDSRMVELVRGLWTGWRSTTFLNTTFNRAYLHAFNRAAETRLGVPLTVWARVLGDDMYGQVTSEWAGLQLLSCMDIFGFDAQAEKQMLGPRRGEFLRLMYRDGTSVTGSLARAVAGLTSGDGQTSKREGGPQTAYALNEGLHRLVRRGASLEAVEALRYHLVGYWAGVRLHGPDGMVETVRPPHWLLTLHRRHGGMGCGRYGVVPPAGIETDPMGATPAMPRAWVKGLLAYGSKLAVHIGWTRLKHVLKEMPAWQDHALPLSFSVLPEPVTRGWRNEVKARTAFWYRHAVARPAQSLCSPAEVAAIRKNVVAGLGYLQRAAVRGCTKDLIAHDVEESVQHVVASTLRELAPIQGIYRRLGSSAKKRWNAALQNSDAAALNARQTAQLYGRRLAASVADGGVSLTVDGAGLVGAGHRVLSLVTMNRALDATRHKTITATRPVAWVNSVLIEAERCLVSHIMNHQYWVSQMAY
jgi:hypothetical protein